MQWRRSRRGVARRTPSRTRRGLRALGIVVASVLALEATARWGVALAIALAPSALSTAPSLALS